MSGRRDSSVAPEEGTFAPRRQGALSASFWANIPFTTRTPVTGIHRLLCRIGLHAWVTVATRRSSRPETGEFRTVCAVCGVRR